MKFFRGIIILIVILIIIKIILALANILVLVLFSFLDLENDHIVGNLKLLLMWAIALAFVPKDC